MQTVKINHRKAQFVYDEIVNLLSPHGVEFSPQEVADNMAACQLAAAQICLSIGGARDSFLANCAASFDIVSDTIKKGSH